MFNYDQIYVTPWLPSAASEAEHRTLVSKLQSWPRLTPDQPYDEAMMSLCFIVQLSSPVQGLQEPDKVERLQAETATLLYRYVVSASTRFRLLQT